MDHPYLEILKEIYASSGIPTILADSEFKILWANDEALLHQCSEKSALCFFEEGASIPAVSGKYGGIRNGFAYSYNVIVHRASGLTLFIIEMLHRDVIRETVQEPSVISYLTDFDAGIRQAVFSISGSASNLYDVLEATESYNEISLVNAQMRECYKILKAIQLPNEVLKYIYNVMDAKVIDLSRFLQASQETFNQILQDKKACLEVEFEGGLYVKADEDRLRYMLLELVLYIIRHSRGIPCAKISAKQVAGDILISVTPGDYDPELLTTYSSPPGRGTVWLSGDSAFKQEADLYIVRQFCERFDGKLYVVTGKDGETAVGVRMPFAELTEWDPLRNHLQSGLEAYQADKFSPFHIGLADIYTFNFFDQI